MEIKVLDLKNYQPLIDYFKKQPIEKAYLFGSYARGEATNSSDIDILVALEKGAGLLKFSRIKIDLEDLFNTKVDLVSSTGVSKYIKPYIDQDKVLIYEKN